MISATRTPFLLTAALPLAALLLAGCDNMNTTQQRVLSGGAIGAGTGAAVTLVTGGCVACGTAVGGAVGAGAGYVYDQIDKRK